MRDGEGAREKRRRARERYIGMVRIYRLLLLKFVQCQWRKSRSDQTRNKTRCSTLENISNIGRIPTKLNAVELINYDVVCETHA